MTRIVCWFSCGAASAVATMLAIRHAPYGSEIVIAYCDTGAEHPDNRRFMEDCEEYWQRPVTVLRSEEYADTWAVWEKRRFLAGISGAPCTSELKIAPRLAFQRDDDWHIFGYTADASDMARATRFRMNWPDVKMQTPLIQHGLDKRAARSILAAKGIAEPVTYAMGFPNANCLPCPKATSPNYWALVRHYAPKQFDRMVKLSRELDVRLTRIAGERLFIDEIPADWPVTAAEAPACDFLCSIASMGLDGAAA